MSALYDMISAFIALLMSAAFLHFGADGDVRPVTRVASAPVAAAPAAQSAASMPAEDVSDDNTDPVAAVPQRHLHAHAHAMAAHGQCQRGVNARPTLEAVHAPSPLRRS